MGLWKKYKKWRGRKRKEYIEKRKNERIQINEEQAYLLQTQGFFFKNPNTFPKMIASEEYAIKMNIPKKYWNATYFKLNGRRIPFRVVNRLTYIYPEKKRKV